MTNKSQIPDIAGKKYSKLTAISFCYSKSQIHYWLFNCDCGNNKILRKNEVKCGRTRSCGCLMRKYPSDTTKSKSYHTWQSMRDRCFNSKNSRYASYGGRGIKVCDKWLKFENFLEDMGQPPSPKHSIDRINNDGDYEPSNCRWSNNTEQTRNQSSNIRIEYLGVIRNLSEWCEILGLNYSTTYNRLITLNWESSKALSFPTRKMTKTIF